jgi:hypothetical protein
MWKRFKRGYVQFKADEPGERFVDAHDHWREYSNGSVATVLIIVAGAVLIVRGFALIAARFRRMAIWLAGAR